MAYASVDNRENQDVNQPEYVWALRPSIALNEDGGPAVVWHANRGGAATDYAVYYTYAVTSTGWISPSMVLNRDQPSMLGSPVIGVGQGDTGDGEQLLHAVYMRPVKMTPDETIWDVYYDSNEDAERYHYVYLPLTTVD
jgi:hypothetical protein